MRPEDRFLADGLDGVGPDDFRLALDEDGTRIYVAASDGGESVHHICTHARGASSASSFRWVFRTHGAMICFGRSNDGPEAGFGIVPDSVIGVRIGTQLALMGRNAYLAVPVTTGHGVTLITRDGEHPVPIFVPEPPPFDPDPGERPYRGRVSWRDGNETRCEISDLDSTDWKFVPGTLLLTGQEPEVSPVTVVLLDGSRAGEEAAAEFICRPEVQDFRIVGRSTFHPRS
jgi:hypothetical protein